MLFAGLSSSKVLVIKLCVDDVWKTEIFSEKKQSTYVRPRDIRELHGSGSNVVHS